MKGRGLKMKFSQDWFSNNIPQFEKFLSHLKNQPCQLLEIGAFEGRSTVWLLENIATDRFARIEVIDKEIQYDFWPNIKEVKGEGKVFLNQGKSCYQLRKLPVSYYDFIYIDGSHSTVNVLEDWVLSFRLAKVNAIIAFDDYLWEGGYHPIDVGHEGTPKKAVDAVLDIYQDKIEVLYKEWQVWVKKIKD